jgi:hypothetical protein
MLARDVELALLACAKYGALLDLVKSTFYSTRTFGDSMQRKWHRKPGAKDRHTFRQVLTTRLVNEGIVSTLPVCDERVRNALGCESCRS